MVNVNVNNDISLKYTINIIEEEIVYLYNMPSI